MEDHDRPRLFRRLTQLTLAVVGESMNHEVIVAMGSAFFVAPYTVITAAHVINGLWDELQSPHLRGRYPKRPVDRAYYAVLGHVPDPDTPDIVTRWQATSAATSAYTDIGVMNVVPVNEAAERLIWPSFPELSLIPPELGASVAALGYPEAAHEEISEGVVKFSLTSKLSAGIVTANHADGRLQWRFPHFETTAAFFPGMSGGPVIDDGELSGVVSYGATEVSGVTNSYAAALWPLLLAGPTTSVDPRSSIPLLNMLETGAIRAPGWRAIHKRAEVLENIDGTRVAILRPPAG